MAKTDKQDDNSVRLITPRVVYAYPKLGPKPDVGTKEFPKKPEFNVTGIFKPGDKWIMGKALVDHADVVAKLEKMRDAEYDRQLAEAKAKKNGKLIKLLNKVDVLVAVVDEEGNDTGEVRVRAKTSAQYKDKKTDQLVDKDPPNMFDAKGKRLDKLPPIGGGSEGKLAVLAKPYFVASSGAVGITFYLEGTQLLKLVKYSGGKSAGSLGFGQEDGYTDDTEEGTFPADESGDPSPTDVGNTGAGDDF